MAKVFIFSNSFMARSLLLELKFIVNLRIDRVLLLKENHNEQVDFTGCKIQVETFPTLDECIKLADIVIIAYCVRLPRASIKFIIDTCEKQDKMCIQIPEMHLSMIKSLKRVETVFINKSLRCPVILDIATSNFSQQFCGELKINQMLSENAIVFRQVFSDCTEQILQIFLKYGLLKNELEKHLNCLEEIFDVLVVPMSLEGLTSKKSNAKEEVIKRLHPDIIIVQADIGNGNFERIFDIIFQYFGKKPNMIIMSRYKKVHGEYLVYCNDFQFDHSGYRVFDLESEKLISNLKWSIFPEISLPQGVIRI